MKSTGIVRKVDELGRIVLPIELRRKYQPACIFCDDARDVINFKGKNVCPNCIKELMDK